MACPTGRVLLEEGRAPDWWSSATVIVAEGVPDFLTWATQFDDAQKMPAVFGIISSSWTREIALRIPGGSRVLVRTHHDDAGHRYAVTIADSLSDRCDVLVPRLSL